MFDAKTSARKIDSGFICSNGPAFSLDGTRAYFTDSYAYEIWRYDIDTATGEAGPRQSFAKIKPEDGYPDGMTLDAEGFLWNAHWDGWRITVRMAHLSVVGSHSVNGVAELHTALLKKGALPGVQHSIPENLITRRTALPHAAGC